ncbi:hypothetical protein MNBD_DELTA01-1270 [hydrothermal vent metagenome]|uniref:TPR domain protein, component of TonB system n=1 Tax=hydrothermal vent metagenome TaxID=652676 RepID=A0A3B0QPK1_9ZZZZ
MKMKVFLVAIAFVLALITVGPTLAGAATDKEISEAKELLRQVEKSSFDVELEETRGMLDKIERMQYGEDKTWKSLIMKAFKRSWRLYKKRPSVPETSFLVARSFFYNGRPDKAKRALRKTFYYNSKYVGAHILIADIKLAGSKNDIDDDDDGIDFLQIEQSRKTYEKVLLLKDVDDEDRSKVFMKIGDIYADMGIDKKKSQDYWQRSYDAAPESFWGKRSKKRMTEID